MKARLRIDGECVLEIEIPEEEGQGVPPRVYATRAAVTGMELDREAGVLTLHRAAEVDTFTLDRVVDGVALYDLVPR